ncbi:MAG: DNA gyrase inhibitor YacG [Candidatus Thiodiazotropha sp. (ex Monitilora ramsayi)]|nr:DNA gyrase inhibitor YacG [Candidatus Thiodiazotropha sp. (ex Monitilora ramsayi)]
MSTKDSTRRKQTTVPCPTCSKPVTWASTSLWRPFCSERCRLIDLGDWLDENHRISEPLEGYSEDDSSA